MKQVSKQWLLLAVTGAGILPVYKDDATPTEAVRAIRYTLKPGEDGYRLEQVR